MANQIDSRYIAAFNIEDVLLDKDTGAPLSGGLVTFEQSNQPGVLKPVWQVTYTSGNYTYTQLPNPMTLSSIGTFEDALENPVIPYFYPYDAEGNIEYYRVIVESSGLVEQFVRDPVPFVPSSGDTSGAGLFQNEISNPQFAEVLFDTSTASYTYSFNAASLQVVNLAPDWDLIVSCAGVGTVTVSQTTPTGSLNTLTNPGTLLNINSAGLSRLRLRQRIYGSPNLWGSGFLAGTFVAKTFAGVSSTLTLYYSQSNGTVIDQAIVAAVLPGSGAYAAYPGNIDIPVSDSSQDFPDAYIDIEFDIPLSTQIEITSVMVTYTGEANANAIVYEQESQNRQIDHLFHYYKPQLEFKPIPSLLTGWDFPLNPAQAKGPTVTIPTSASVPTAANCYAWDQTISNSLVGSIAVVRNSVTGGFQATTANNLEAFYMIQYLSGAEVKEILGNRLAVNVNAFRTQAGGTVTCKVYLYSGRAAATFPALPTMIGTVAANGVFTLTAANWTLVPRGNLGTASGTLSTVTTSDYTTLNDVEDLSFNGWELTDTAQIADTNKFAIVVTFSCPTTGTVVVVDSISMVKGDIPTRPGAKTLDETLFDCQYYYAKSFLYGVVPANNIGNGSGESYGVLANINPALVVGPMVKFTTEMRATPTIALYNPALGGAAGQIRDLTAANDLSSSAVSIASPQSFATEGIPIAGPQPGQLLGVHWTADARLGIV